MKYENVKHYDGKTKAITLVTGVKDYENKEVEVKKYQHPFFTKGFFIKRAIELGAEFEENEQVIPMDLLNRLTNFITELYNNQFTDEELINGINSDRIIDR